MNDAALWKPEYFRLFLSHANVGKESATQLKDRLDAFLIDAFVAHEDIAPTHEWIEVIEQALKSCNALAALLTPDFHESYWTDHEIGYCLGRDVLIVPVRLGLDPYGFIARYQGVRGLGLSIEDLAVGICEALIGNERSVERITQPLVLAFRESHSFANANVKMGLLEKLPRLDQRQLHHIEESIDSNNQVKQATGVPSRIFALREKHGMQTRQVQRAELRPSRPVPRPPPPRVPGRAGEGENAPP